MEYTGQYQVKLDRNGRFKLPPKAWQELGNGGNDEVIVHCLPEGCLGIYTEANWRLCRQQLTDSNPQTSMAGSMLARRTMRRFGALTQSVHITGQGRLTVPSSFRSFAQVEDQMVLVGCEIGYELWAADLWQRELALINQHLIDRGALEMTQDLNAEGTYE